MNKVTDTKLRTFILAVGDAFRKSTQIMNVKTIDKDYLIEWLNENTWSANAKVDPIVMVLSGLVIGITVCYLLLPIDWVINSKV